MNDLLTVPPPSADDLERDATADYTRGLRIVDENGNQESIRRHGEWMYGVLPAWIRRHEALRAQFKAVEAERNEFIRLARLYANAPTEEETSVAAYDLVQLSRGCGHLDTPKPVALQLIERAEELEAENERLDAENERLKAALAPFAAYAFHIYYQQHDEVAVGSYEDATPHRAPKPTLGDCRRAAEALGQEARR